MIRNIVWIVVLFLSLTFLSCVSGQAPAPLIEGREAMVKTEKKAISQGVWERDWQETLAEAKREGRLSIYGGGGPAMRQAVGPALKDKFGLDIEWTLGSSAGMGEKILRERRAGLYLADLYMDGGSAPPLTVFKPAGILEPIRPLLILPEVLDEKAWYGGQLPFLDVEKSYVIMPNLRVQGHVAINTDMVKPEEISSYENLLEPRWREKIVMDDPTAGPPHVNIGVLLANKGPDFMRKLAENRPALVGDFRLAVEWVARGKYLINLTPRAEIAAEFIKVGAPLKMVMPRGGGSLAGSPICSFSRAPHPNAVKVFLNWILGKEASTLYSRVSLAQSSREDVPTDHLAPGEIRDPSFKYLMASGEEFALRRVADNQLLKEIFGPPLKQ